METEHKVIEQGYQPLIKTDTQVFCDTLGCTDTKLLWKKLE